MDKNLHFTEEMKNESCVLVMSGGQDSTTCLGIALAHFKQVHCISFTYGQKHQIETLCAKRIVDQFENVTFEIIPVDALQHIGDSALIRGTNQQSVNAEHTNKPGLPASFVPNRNATFLTIAHAYAQKLGAEFVMTGVCQTDYSGYPDCRRPFVDTLCAALNAGSNATIEILTPLMNVTKAQTFQLAEQYNILDEVINLTHTCYNGKRDDEFYHEWGHGCGECPACELRKKGWQEFVEMS